MESPWATLRCAQRKQIHLRGGAIRIRIRRIPAASTGPTMPSLTKLPYRASLWAMLLVGAAGLVFLPGVLGWGNFPLLYSGWHWDVWVICGFVLAPGIVPVQFVLR